MTGDAAGNISGTGPDGAGGIAGGAATDVT